MQEKVDAKKEFSYTENCRNIYRTGKGIMPLVKNLADKLSNGHFTKSASALLTLQQIHGNQHVQRVVAKIQAKIEGGQSEGVYEEGADLLVGEVMHAARREYAKINKMVSESEFGAYYKGKQ